MSKARQLADLGNQVDDGAITGSNMVINGAMQVAQRSSSVTGVTSNGYYTCDRMEVNVSNLGAYTVTQENDAPEGFVNSLKIDCTTADASPASSDYVFFTHKLEGQDLQHLKKGTSNALPVTLSFWVKSNITGTYQFNLRDNDNVRYISASYTIDASGAWEYKTITLAGDTTGVLDNDANESLKLEWWLDSGSNFNSGTLNTSWAAASNANRNAGATVNIGDSTSNYWQITGVCLNVGDSAIDFPHDESYGETLAKCQRFYYQKQQKGRRGGGVFTKNQNRNQGRLYLPQVMRASPSFTATRSYGDGIFASASITANNGYANAIQPEYVDVEIDVDIESGGGNGGTWEFDFYFDAEL
jgi:hypothetical protein